MEPPRVSRLILYVRDMPTIAAFYATHFGFESKATEDGAGYLLTPPAGGCSLMLLQASKGHKIGQSCIKIVFDVEDVEAYKKQCAEAGLEFGPTHHEGGYSYANARDPAKNLVQISDRAYIGLR